MHNKGPQLKMKIVPLSLIALSLISASSCYVSKLVDTLSGPVQGLLTELDGQPVEVFLGVPYAEPPIGDLRFLKPQPMKSWTKTLRAAIVPPACVQYTPYPYPWADNSPGQSEDCLYMNIYVPLNVKNESNLAVLFWIHGGGLTYGSNRADTYDARALAIHGGVIVVTINYRLGVFGFVTSNTSDAPGNVGIYDTLLALQWINDNIESFGGDKKRITLQGQSAGSLIVSVLCVSPLARGLFSRAILQSGTIILVRNQALEENLDLSQRLAEAVGCATTDQTIRNDPESVVNCLRRQDAQNLVRTFWAFNPMSTRSFFPQYGDELIPRSPLDDIRTYNFQNVPLLVGNVRDEGSFQISVGNSQLFGFLGQKNGNINKTQAETLVRNIFRTFNDTERYVRFYLAGIQDDDFVGLRRQVYTASGDISLFCTTVYFAERYADRNNNVYYYLFTHRPSNTIWAYWMGVAHFEEVQFVFGRPIRRPYLYEPDEVELSRNMIRIWSNFAKNGNPADSFVWPKYSRQNPTFVYIDTNFTGDTFGVGPHQETCNFIRDGFGF